MSVNKKQSQAILSIILSIVGLIILVPFIYMVSTSLKSKPEIMNKAGGFFPTTIVWDHYKKVFRSIPYFSVLFNSFFVSAVTTFIAVYFSTMVGFGISKYPSKITKSILLIFVSAMMVPPFMIGLPLYLVAAPLGFTNNLGAVIIPFAVSNFGIFLMTQYCVSIPQELLEAARIDGAGELLIFNKIALPLVSAGVSAFGILKFLMTWNDFFFPLIMLTKEKKMTLQVMLATSIDFEYGVDYGYVMALSTLVVLPVIIIFVIFQRKIIEGVSAQGLKY